MKAHNRSEDAAAAGATAAAGAPASDQADGVGRDPTRAAKQLPPTPMPIAATLPGARIKQLP